jgi:putative SOS response-associated peptidase YedK
MVLSSPEAIRRLFGYPEQPNFPPRYNVAPTQPVPIVRIVEGLGFFTMALIELAREGRIALSEMDHYR